MQQQEILGMIGLVCLLSVLSCGRGDRHKTDAAADSKDAVCLSGDTQPCGCREGQSDGTQICSPGGVSWSTCTCGDESRIAESGYVVDKETGIWWQHPPSGNYLTYDEAVEYCENLSVAGKTDWILPGFQAFVQFLGDCTETTPGDDWIFCNPCSDESRCSDLIGDGYGLYWTSLVYAPDDVRAWRVRMLNGSLYFTSKKQAYNVLCIRNPPF